MGLRLLFAVVALLLLLLLVCQLGTGLCVLFAVSLLLPLLVCQPGMGLCVLLAVAVSLLLPGCGGHVVEIVLKFLVQGNNISEAAAASSLQDHI